MTPHLKIEILRPHFPWVWAKFVIGFRPRDCCAKCLKGRLWPNIAFEQRPAGTVYEGDVEFEEGEEILYICAVNAKQGYDWNVHLPTVRNPRSQWVYDDGDIRVACRGLKRLLPIPPLPEDVAANVSTAQSRCRNYAFGYSRWPFQGLPTLF